MVYKASRIDFSPLGEIGGIVESGIEKEHIRQTLADLDTTSASGMRTAASRLFKLGTEPAMKRALELHTAAQAQENLAQTKVRDAAYAKYFNDPTTQARLFGNPASPMAPGQSPISGTIPPWDTPEPGAAPGAPPGAPFPAAPGGPLPSELRPSGAVAPPAAAAAPAPPPRPFFDPNKGAAGPPVGPMEMSAQARAPGGTPIAPPVPPSLPGEMPGFARPVPGLPSGLPGEGAAAAPVAPTGPPRQPPPGMPASERIKFYATELMKVGSKDPGASATYRALLNAEIDQAKMPDDWKNWQKDVAERYTRGESYITHAQWEALKKRKPEMSKEAYEFAATKYDAREKAGGLLDNLGIMEKIAADPRFISGPGSAGYAQLWNAAGTVRDALVAVGIPADKLPFIKEGMEGAALNDTYQMLAKRYLLESAPGGRLSTGFSNEDRRAMEVANAHVGLGKEGMALQHAIMRAVAERAVKMGDVVEKYMTSKAAGPDAIDATRTKIEVEMKKFAASNPIFFEADGKTPNALGLQLRRVQAMGGKQTPLDRAPAPARAGGAAGTAARIRESREQAPAPAAAPEGTLSKPLPITREMEGTSGVLPDGTPFVIRGGKVERQLRE